VSVSSDKAGATNDLSINHEMICVTFGPFRRYNVVG
jgi:hypothetical protein